VTSEVSGGGKKPLPYLVFPPFEVENAVFGVRGGGSWVQVGRGVFVVGIFCGCVWGLLGEDRVGWVGFCWGGCGLFGWFHFMGRVVGYRGGHFICFFPETTFPLHKGFDPPFSSVQLCLLVCAPGFWGQGGVSGLHGTHWFPVFCLHPPPPCFFFPMV